MFDRVTPGGLVAAAVGLSASTAVELLAPDLPGLAGATLVAVQAAGNVAGHAIDQRRQRAGQALEHAARSADMDLAQLTAAILADPALVDLTMNALDAAVRTRREVKIRTLGRAIATGALAEDEALVDEQQFFVRALAQIEVPHLRVLQIMSEPRVPLPDLPNPYRKTYLNWSVQDLTACYPQSGYLVETICAALASAGVISQDSEPAIAGGPTYRINAFGRAVLTTLTEEGLPPLRDA